MYTHTETMTTHDISILLHTNLTVDHELELIFCVSLSLLNCMWCCLSMFVCKACPLYLVVLNCNVMVKNKYIWGDFLRGWLHSDVWLIYFYSLLLISSSDFQMPTLGIKAYNNKWHQIISRSLQLFSKRDSLYLILDSVVPHHPLQSYRNKDSGKAICHKPFA